MPHCSLKSEIPDLKLPILSDWPDTAREAIELQKKLHGQIKIENEFGIVKTICGVDCSYDLNTNISRAVLTVFSFPDLNLLESCMAHLPTTFPYISGLLSFREIPVVFEAFKILSYKPDLLMVDGMGIAHPRRMGIATHLGLVLDIPAIGVGKSLLCGTYTMPAMHKGAKSDLIHKGDKIGTVLRSKDNTRPLFISPGHKIDHEASVKFTLNCVFKYRLPEPTHYADKFSKIRLRKKE